LRWVAYYEFSLFLPQLRQLQGEQRGDTNDAILQRLCWVENCECASFDANAVQ
jgi:hypothetical protein